MFSAFDPPRDTDRPNGRFALYTVYNDGTGFRLLSGEDQGSWLKRGAAAYGEDRIAYVTAEKADPFGAGRVLTFSINDAFGEQIPLAGAETSTVADVAALGDNRFLMAMRPDDASTFGLYRLDRGRISPVWQHSQWHALSPVSTAPRTASPGMDSTPAGALTRQRSVPVGRYETMYGTPPELPLT